MSSLRQRVAAGVVANASGHAITIGIQLLSLPFFLSHWNATQYGIWLMLSAVPAYFSMSDVGMVTAAGNRMTMAMGRGDVKEATRVFQSAFVFMLGGCSLIAAIALPVIAFVPLPGLIDTERRIALAALVAGVLLALFNGLAEALFRATGRYALGTLLGHVLRLVEWSGAMIGLFMFGDFVAVAVGSLTARAIGMLGLVAWSRFKSQGIQWGLSHSSWQEVRDLAAPAMLFMVFPLANALSLQGFTLLVGSLLGPAVVAVFSTYRTLARIAVQATSTLSMAVGPEFSRLYGAGDAPNLRRTFRRAALLGMGIAVGLSLILYLLSPSLLRLWTHGVIPYQPGLMGVILAYAAVGGLWHVPRILLVSTNQHGPLAGAFLAVSCISLLVGWLLGQQFGLSGIPMALLLSEIVIAILCTALALRFQRSMPTIKQPLAA